MTQRQFDRYEILEAIGEGGMATVYRAYDPRFRREVALKILPANFLEDPAFRTRFEREAQAIASLEHLGIVPVYDFGEANNQPYLVMRLMTGGSLADRLEKGPLPLSEITRIYNRLASALDVAHRQGIIHRDLKPANILFDQYGEPYLADFGIAKWALEGDTSKALTGTGATVGTPAYMSPEQVQGQVLDGRSDVYALGIILFEMLTGKRPYEATTPMALALKHVVEPIPTLQSPHIPPVCQTVINRAMAKSPDQRYESAAALAQDLSAISTGSQPIPNLPSPLPTTAPTVASSSPTTGPTEVMMPTPPPRPAVQPPTPASVETTPGPARGRKLPLVPLMGGTLLGLLLCVGLIALITSLINNRPDEETPIPDTTAIITDPNLDNSAVDDVPECVAGADCVTPPADEPIAALTLTLWYPDFPGSDAEEALFAVLEQTRQAFPNITLVAEAIPLDELNDRWRDAVAQPDGPDMLIYPSDFLVSPEEAALDMTDWVGDRASNLEITALQSLQVEGRQMGLPLSSKIAVLYANNALMGIQPQSLEELRQFVENGHSLALWQNAYYMYGFFPAFGAEIIEGETACPGGPAPMITTLRYLLSLQEAGAFIAPDLSEAQASFRQGELHMIIDGSWMWSDYGDVLGDDLAVYPVPPGISAFQPLNGPDGIYISPNTSDANTAVDVALFMTNVEAQEIFMNVAHTIPVNQEVSLPDVRQANMVIAAAAATPWNNEPAFTDYWDVFNGLLGAVLAEERAPALSVAATCTLYQNQLDNNQ
ncbi:MAG: extracellular solute-binding protein [Chloroflexi bacterium]|nr:extracellular solute-binding protein [Chloroflexota bacterium]